MLEDFKRREQLPVDVNDVLAEIRERGVDDIIDFYQDLELDTRVIRGFLNRVSFEKDGRKRFHSKITFGKLDPETERVVCTKELLHILDPEALKAQDRGELQSLISEMSLPAALASPFTEDDKAWNDRLAVLEAISILFPLGARAILYEKYMAGRIPLPWIAEQAELPLESIAPVMRGDWPSVVDSLIGRRLRMEERAKARALPQKRQPKRPTGKKGGSSSARR